MQASMNDESNDIAIVQPPSTSGKQKKGWQKGDFMTGASGPKRAKATFAWKVAYEAVLSHLPDQGTQRVNLSHAYEKGELKKSIINIRKYTAAGRATTDGMFFDAEEIHFLLEHMPQAATAHHEYRQKQVFGDRTVSVSNRRVRDLDYVPPTEGDVIDGYKHKTVVVVGSRKNDFMLARELDLKVVDRLVEELNNISFILGQKTMPPNVIYDHFFGILLLNMIEKDTTKWCQVEEVLLADENELRRVVEDTFDFDGFELRLQTSRNCKAFGFEPVVLANRFNSAIGGKALQECLALRLYADRFSANLFRKIGQKMLN